jgi:DNA-binding NtrC family response regulator
LREALNKHERQIIEATLKKVQYNITRAAEALDIHRVVLHRKMKAYGIKK